MECGLQFLVWFCILGGNRERCKLVGLPGDFFPGYWNERAGAFVVWRISELSYDCQLWCRVFVENLCGSGAFVSNNRTGASCVFY